MTFIVLQAYTFINLFMCNMFSFCQYKKHKFSQILHNGTLSGRWGRCRSRKHGQRWSHRCEKAWRKTEDEEAAEAEDADNGGDEDAEEVALRLCCKQTLLLLLWTLLHPVVSRRPGSSRICYINASLWIQFHHVLQAVCCSSRLLYPCRSVIRNTPANSTLDPNSFPNCWKILKLYWFTRGIFQILLRRLFGLLAVGALEKDLQSWKRCFVWVCYFLVLKEKKNKTNPIYSPCLEGYWVCDASMCGV